MKLIRKLFGIIAVVFFFFLGISAADKAYLSESIIGICIIYDDRREDDFINLSDQIMQMQCSDARSLCRQLQKMNGDMTITCEKQYFDYDISGNTCIPAGVYDTVFIDIGGQNCLEASFFKQINGLTRRFELVDEDNYAVLQKKYISFLSFIGQIEKAALGFMGQ